MDKSDHIAALVEYRLEQALECLDSAKLSMDTSLKFAANRSYYCIFHSMRAVLATIGFDSKKHSGVIGEFRQKFIKSGAFPKHLSNYIKDAFTIRNHSDYMDFYVVAREDVETQIKNAEEFYSTAKKYLIGDKP